MYTRVHIYSVFAVSVVTLTVGWLIYQHTLTTERTEHVFIYATLKNPIIRTLACGCIVSSTAATLPHYTQDGRTIHPASRSSVHGQRIVVTPTELARLDQYERVPTRYRRARTLLNDQLVWVYIKNE